MQGGISSGRGGRRLLVVFAALLGLLLAPSASVSAETTSGLTLFVFDPIGAEVVGSTGSLQAVRAAGGGEETSVASATPAVCEVTGEAPGRGFPEREVVAETRYLTPGTCTFVASLPQTAEHEALEATSSVVVAAVTFTSRPPRRAVAGGSYEVAASLTPSVPARLGVEGGACTFTKSSVEQSLPAAPHSERRRQAPAAPATVYFLRRGRCTITAGGENPSERVSQSFTVAKGAPERISFASTPSSDATVGGAYSPTARSSLGWPLVFSTATPAVCRIVLGSTRSVTLNRGGVLPPSAVDFVSAGTCTINLKPAEEALGEGLEAQQSFTVSAAGGPASAPSAPKRTPSSLKLIGAKKPQVLCTAKASRCATLIIHVYGSGGPAPGLDRAPLETQKVRVEKLGAHDEVLASIVTRNHRLRIAPGRYKATLGGEGMFGKKVVVRAGQAREITLEAKIR